MGVADCVTDLQKQVQALTQREGALLAEDVYRLACHILHGEIRKAVGAFAAVQDPSDVGVIQQGEYVALAFKPLWQKRGVGGRYDLDRDYLLKRTIDALGQIHRAHTSDANQRKDAVGARYVAGRELGRAPHGSGDLVDGVLKPGLGVTV